MEKQDVTLNRNWEEKIFFHFQNIFEEDAIPLSALIYETKEIAFRNHNKHFMEGYTFIAGLCFDYNYHLSVIQTANKFLYKHYLCLLNYTKFRHNPQYTSTRNKSSPFSLFVF